MTEREGLTIVVPAFDEEACLERVVRAAVTAAEDTCGVPFEVVIVDDGSSDQTAVAAARLAAEDPRLRLVRHATNFGSGMAIRTGIEAARFPFVTYVPADGQFDVRELGRYVAAARDADIVVGVRTSRDCDSTYRRVQSRLFRFLMRGVFGLRIVDPNWVHLWRRAVFEELRPRSTGVFFLGETLALADRAGMRIRSIESSYAPRQGGSAKGARPLTAMKTLAEMLLLRGRLALARP